MFNWINKLLTGSGKSVAAEIRNQAGTTPQAAVQRDECEAWQKRGNAFLGDGDLRQAFDCYRRALAIDPGFMDACISLAYVLMEQNNPGEAEPYLERALRIDPANADAHYMLGSIASSRNDLAAAARHWHAAVELRPDFDRAWQDLLNLGNMLQAEGDLDAAVDVYGRALQIKPSDIIACNNLGLVLGKRGKHDDAIVLFDKAASIAPNSAEVHFNLGNAFKAQGNLSQAIEHYHKAVSIDPDDPEIHNNLGNACLEQDQLEAAIDSYRKALSINPGYAMTYCNLGLALQAQGRLEEALDCCHRALVIAPELAVAHWTESLCRLLTGDFENGWKKYEWRWKYDALKKPKPDFEQPIWLGDEPLAGKTILLYSEQGIGDAIQFYRYTTLLSAKGAKVVMQVPEELASLLAEQDNPCRIVPKGEPLPPFDCYCPLLSLGLAFGTTLETIPANAAYLHAPPTKVARWQAKLGPGKLPRIGLVWSGNALHSNDRRRSIPLASLARIMSPHFHFVSLQKEVRPADLVTLQDLPAVFHAGDVLDDFADTAGLIANLDIVISVDTSVAHLAGALGKPAWILLPFNPDWRWLLERSDSPWYPSARLFRQPGPGDWDSVIANVANALKEFTGSGMQTGSQ
jgi:tetratricopeptide (TPR) repeat protein